MIYTIIMIILLFIIFTLLGRYISRPFAEVQDDMKAEYLSQVKNLETKRDDFAVKYGQLKESSEQACDDVKVRTEKKWSEFKESIQKAASRFK